MYFTLKQRGKDHFHVVSTWNKRDVFVGKVASKTTNYLSSKKNSMGKEETDIRTSISMLDKQTFSLKVCSGHHYTKSVQSLRRKQKTL